MATLQRLFLLLCVYALMESTPKAIADEVTDSTGTLDFTDNASTDLYADATTPGDKPEPPGAQGCTLAELRANFGYTLSIIEFMQHYKIVFLLPIACVGNFLAFLGNYEKARKSSPHFYMTALAVADTLSYATREVTYFIASFQVKFNSQEECMFMAFCSFFFTALSIWILVTMTVERVIVVWMPLKASQILSSKSAGIGVAVIIVVIALLGIPRALAAWYVFDPYRGIMICTEDITRAATAPGQWINAIMTGYLPAAVLFLSNFFIIVGIQQARKRKEAMTGGQKKNSQETQVTIMMVVISISFVVLVTPEMLIHTGSVFNDGITCAHYMAWARFALTSFYLFDLNNVINGYLYCLSSAGFRKELSKKLCCCGRRGRGGGSSAASSTRMTGVSMSAISSGNFTEKGIEGNQAKSMPA